MKLKGEIRGAAIKEVAQFILKEEGEEGLRKLEDAITKAGYLLEYKNIKTMEFYPLGLEAAILVAAERIFNYNEKKFQEAGEFAPKSSVILIRIFMKYFISLPRVVKEVPRIWRKHYTVGDLKSIELNEKEKYAILRLENFQYVPMACHIFRGYFIGALKMVLKTKATCEETKCIYRGDDYHEFLVKW